MQKGHHLNNHKKITDYLLHFTLAFGLFLFAHNPLQAQGFERISDVEAEVYTNHVIVNGDYETLKNVRRFWQQEIQRLHSNRMLEFNLTGSNDAILKVNIPSRILFEANDSTLIANAEGVLRPFLRLVKGDDAVATLVVAAYTDNNGSDAYLQRLSSGRANAIHRWFAKQGLGPANIHSFGFGNRVPRNANINIKQREKNRRVSLYLVPNKKMLKNAKKGNLIK